MHVGNSNQTEKFALVTGAAKGIGKSIAIKLAGNGINVAINYKSSKDDAIFLSDMINKTYGVESFTVQADVSSSGQVTDMMDKIIQTWGKIDILINNAGIIQDQLLVRMSDEAWDNVIGTNLNGTFYCTRAAIKSMLKTRWGRVINIGSVVGIRGNPGQSNYTASKAAIIGFTKAVAKEVAKRNITVNCVTPGYLETETTAILTDSQKEFWLSAIPQGKFGELDDISNLVLYLSDEKSKYITGQVISVDGGMAV